MAGARFARKTTPQRKLDGTATDAQIALMPKKLFEKGNAGPRGFLKMQSELAELAAGSPNERRDIVQLARKYTSSAIFQLVKIMRNGEEQGAARVSAAKAILERGWGPVEKASELFKGLTDQQLVEAAKQIIAQDRGRVTVHSDKTVIVREPDGARVLHADDVVNQQLAANAGKEEDDE